MAAVSGNNQPVRLRDLRDSALPRDKSEVRAPTRRAKFEDKLRDDKAGEIVGEFPQKFDKGLGKQTLRRSPLLVATERQQPRQAVAALMAREGISTATKFGAGALLKREQPARDEGKVEASKKPAWMMLAGDGEKAESSGGAFAERIAKLREQQKELQALRKFGDDLGGGASSLDKHLRSNDKRILDEAGRLDRSAAMRSGNKEMMNIELMKKEMAMNQALNMQYLQLQERLSRPIYTLLSNLLKTRNEATKSAISGA